MKALLEMANNITHWNNKYKNVTLGDTHFSNYKWKNQIRLNALFCLIKSFTYMLKFSSCDYFLSEKYITVFYDLHYLKGRRESQDVNNGTDTFQFHINSDFRS